jgi:Tol biopolymer transport system component
MTKDTRVLAVAILALAVSGCGGENAAETPAVAFEGTIVVTAAITVEGASGSSMTRAIYLLDTQGTHQLATDGFVGGPSPVWSPDGTQIAYITTDLQLAVINRDGTGGATLTPKSSDQSLWPSGPEWLPNGNITVETDGKLVVLGPDGTGVAVMTPPRFTDKYALSPDGKQVVYDCSLSTSFEVCHFGLETGASQTLLTPPRPFYSFSWSPDGKQIVAGDWTTAQDLAVDTAYEDLYVFGVDGSDLHALSQPGKESNPAWSPDGKMIVYNSFTGDGEDTQLGLWMINADGTGAIPLLSAAFLQPDWTAR